MQNKKKKKKVLSWSEISSALPRIETVQKYYNNNKDHWKTSSPVGRSVEDGEERGVFRRARQDGARLCSGTPLPSAPRSGRARTGSASPAPPALLGAVPCRAAPKATGTAGAGPSGPPPLPAASPAFKPPG